jgi:proline dehydrogenase
LYALAVNETFERAARAVPALERAAYRRAQTYVAGSTLDDAIARVRSLSEDGFASSLDFFGESKTAPQAIDRVVSAYEQAAAALDGDLDVDLEVVPSHLGIDVSADFCRRYLERIIEILPKGSRLQISAEESQRMPAILETTLALARAGAPVVQTLQANLRRTEQEVDRLLEAQVPIRLVKGAYVEPPKVAYPWGEQTDKAYVRVAHKLHNGGGELSLGTHDHAIRDVLLRELQGVRIDMLLGVRP